MSVRPGCPKKHARSDEILGCQKHDVRCGPRPGACLEWPATDLSRLRLAATALDEVGIDEVDVDEFDLDEVDFDEVVFACGLFV